MSHHCRWTLQYRPKYDVFHRLLLFSSSTPICNCLLKYVVTQEQEVVAYAEKGFLIFLRLFNRMLRKWIDVTLSHNRILQPPLLLTRQIVIRSFVDLWTMQLIRAVTYIRTNKMQLWQYCLLVTARSLYMFRTLSAPIIRSTKNCSNSHWCMSWVGMVYIQ